jgi:thiol-disulfide isomerase/thioredoxin
MIKLKFNKAVIFIIIALMVGLLVGAGIIYLINQRDAQNIVSKEEAREKIYNFIRQQLPPDTLFSITNIISEKGLYKITINIQEQEHITYLTKDGSLFFPQAIGLAEEQELPVETLEALAKCLTEKGVRFYGTYWCPACDRQKEIFGAVAQYLPYIECAEDRATPEELALCQEAGIASVPDWRFPDGRQELGILSAERLAELSGCSL